MGDRMLARTDLAIERKKYEETDIFTEKIGEYLIEKIEEENATHITITLPSLILHGGFLDEGEAVLAEQISSLVPKGDGTVLVAGLGNREITPDALGPAAIGRIFATRHISRELAKQINLEQLRSVASIAPSVLGKTGIEVAEILSALSGAVKPKAVIVIDALCAADINRLGCTLQISNGGIRPGSGVKNSRAEISQNTLGVPVIAIGLPTVIDAAGIISTGEPFVVTPKDIDLLIDRAATLIGNAVNIALQPDTDAEILRALV